MHGTFRKKYSNRDRQEIYDLCCGDKSQPDCNICDLPVLHGDEWDVSHDPKGMPAAAGGTDVGIAHRKCNRWHGHKVVKPLLAKMTRIHQRFTGAFETKVKLPGGKWDSRKKKMDGSVVARDTPAEKFRKMRGVK